MADEAGNSIDISDAISRLMANPQLIQTVASALGGSADNTVVEAPSKEAATLNTPELPIGDMLPMLSKLSSAKDTSAQQSNSVCLLKALKPYMNPRRCDAIDKLVTFSGFSDILKKL